MPTRLLTAGLLLAGVVPARGQAAARPVALSVSLGLNAPVRYHAPLSPFGRTVGPSASLELGVPPGRQWLSPRVGASAHFARADVSRIDVVRLELGLLFSPRLPLGAVVPFASIGGAVYRGHYDTCAVPVLGDPGDPGDPGEAGGCAGTRTGAGWQAALGAAYRARHGAAPFAEFRYTASRRAFDGLVLAVGVVL